MRFVYTTHPVDLDTETWEALSFPEVPVLQQSEQLIMTSALVVMETTFATGLLIGFAVATGQPILAAGVDDPQINELMEWYPFGGVIASQEPTEIVHWLERISFNDDGFPVIAP